MIVCTVTLKTSQKAAPGRINFDVSKNTNEPPPYTGSHVWPVRQAQVEAFNPQNPWVHGMLCKVVDTAGYVPWRDSFSFINCLFIPFE